MVFTVPFVKTKSRSYKKESPANNVFTPFAGDRLVPLTGLEFYYAVFFILSNVAQTT